MTTDSRTAELGGVATGPADRTVALHARTYTHPALGERHVVRLVRDDLTEVEDLSLAVLGLEPQGSEPVGHVRQRAVGFPAWPIIHDPKNARHALNLVQDLRRAATLARSKPGHAKELLDGHAVTLGSSAPHFLPTFLEEAARIFLARDNRTYAVQFFGRAREAERVHGLQIDEERHRQVLLEFALAGAVGAKELGNEARALLERTTPQEALDTFLRLNIDRVRGGLPPYAGVATDLRRLAKAAGADQREVQEQLVHDLVGASALTRAPAGFWKTSLPVLVRLAGQHAEVRDWMAANSPHHLPDDEWIEALEAAGVAQELRDGTRDTAAWVESHLRQTVSRWRGGYPRRLSQLLRECSALAGQTVHIPAEVWRVEPEVVDALLGAGASVEWEESRWHTERELDLKAWSDQPQRPDLPHLAAHPELSAATRRSVGVLVAQGQLGVLLEHPGTTSLVRARAGHGLGEDPTLGEIRDAVHRLAPLWTDEGYAAMGDLLEALADRVDGPELLARALRDGLLTELTWPTLEQVAGELGRAAAPDAAGPPEVVTTHEAWPAVGVAAGGRVAFVDGADVVAQAEFAPLGGTEPGMWRYTLVDGAVGCAYRSSTWQFHLTWSTAPAMSADIGYVYTSDFLTCSFAVPGGRLVGPAIQRPGTPTAEFTSAASNLLHDGVTFWASGSDGVVEIDPGTGQSVRASLPADLADLIEDSVRDGWRLDVAMTSWRPTTPATAQSLVSTIDGQHRWVALHRKRASRLIDADGRVTEVPWRTGAVGRVRRPGGGHWLQGLHGLLREGSQAPLAEASDAHGRPHVLHALPPAAWHHLRVRDEAVSQRLRQASAEQVAELCAVVPAASEFGPDPREWDLGYGQQERRGAQVDPLTIEARAAAETLLGSRDPALVDAVVWLAARVNHLVGQMHELRAAVAATPVAQGAGTAGTFVQWQASHELLKGLVPLYAGPSPRSLRSDVLGVGAIARGGRGTVEITVSGLEVAVGAPEAVVALMLAPLQPTADIEGAAAWLGAVRDAGLLDGGVSVFSVFVQITGYQGGLGPGTVLPWTDTRAVLVGWGSSGSYGQGVAEFIALTLAPVPQTVDGRPTMLRATPSDLPSTTILEAVDHLTRHGPPQWRPESIDELAAGTGWSRAAAGLLLTGLRNRWSYEKNFLPKDVRDFLGLKVAEADGARQFLARVHTHVLVTMLAAGARDPLRTVREGLDVPAMVEVWRAFGTPSGVSLPDELRAELASLAGYRGGQTVAALLAPELDPRDRDLIELGVAMCLWLAMRLDRADPLRPWVADRLEALRAGWRVHRFSWLWSPPSVRTALGLPRPPVDGQTDSQTVGAWSVSGSLRGDAITWRPAEVTDWDREATLVAAMGEAGSRARPVVILLSGLLDQVITDLRTPGEGSGQDPLVTAPDVVAQVREALDLPEDAARYWLQLLALPDPTDKHVEAWNGWTARDRAAAAAPLLERGLVMEATRARAGRRLFLPGGWLEATAPHPPLEVWKAPFFELVDGTRVSPALGAVVPLVPLGQLFADAWQRYCSGDVPGYAELRTQRYRRRS